MSSFKFELILLLRVHVYRYMVITGGELCRPYGAQHLLALEAISSSWASMKRKWPEKHLLATWHRGDLWEAHLHVYVYSGKAW